MKSLLSLPFDKDQHLRNLTEITAQLFNAPVSMVTFLDADDQHIITSHGIELKVMPRATSFCTHTIQSNEVLVVSDAQKDKQFNELPLVVYQPHVRFYAGISLKSEGQNIGTLCVFNDQPMEISELQKNQLRKIGEQVSNVLALNLSLDLLHQSNATISEQFRQLREIAFIQSHEVRAPLCNAIALAEMFRDNPEDRNPLHVKLLEKSLSEVDDRIHKIVELTNAAVA